MVKKALLSLLGICAVGGGLGTYAAGYSNMKNKSKGGVAVDSSEKEQDQQKNTKPAAAKTKDADPKPATTKPGVAKQNPPQPPGSGQAASKPGSQARSNPQHNPGQAQSKPNQVPEKKDFGKIAAEWKLREVLTDTYPSITLTANKDNTVSWICVVRWNIPLTSSPPSFSEINQKISEMKSKLIEDGADKNSRNMFIKNCTEGRLQKEEDIIVSSTDNEIFLESKENKDGAKDIEKVYSEDLKDMVRLNKTSYEILIADDWTMEFGDLDGKKNRKITFKTQKKSFQCTVEAKNATEELDAEWKTKFETDVLKEGVSETNFGNHKKILLKNCLDNNNAIKLVGTSDAPLNKEKIRTSLLSNKYKNPVGGSPKVSR